MPPEQASAAKEITTAADVYALGAILYEGLTGRPPHQADSAIATLMKAAKENIVKPSEHNAKVDRVLELICMKCLERDPGQRYGSASMLRDDLLRWLAGESVSVKPRSLVAILGDLVNHQLRSAIGAMLLGVSGGFALGIPLYSGIANRLFGRPESRFSIEALQESLPSSARSTSWWLSPPEFLNGPAVFFGLLFCLMLGLLIRKLVRPKHVQEALAIGLVAGLLMAIVEFGLYGIAAGWQTFAIVNADEIDMLASAAVSNAVGREKAIEGIVGKFPDLQNVPEAQRGKVLGQIVSTQIMLSSPPVTLVCLSGCLVFACIYCVAGTIHSYRLSNHSFSRGNRLLRYVEVLLLLTIAGFLFCVSVFTLSGMISSSDGRVSLSFRVWFSCLVACVLVIPGWIMWRWHFRWASYAIGLGLIVLALSF
ncbi:Serine/threonine-protein kinase PknB [Stieleria varia]|uniref:Serine/threonine-protein kinase PknB n=2 Tax=Stieleria varia TaxID=2528005 RepID=A0A5C5ZXU7_9BACT|nr:Serine/threonine-protein kinase PknB [Stieleria varia]